MSKIFSSDEIKLAAKAINAGELVSFPTETVYGLGADATNPEAVKKVYAAKGRPSDNPLIVHVADQAEVAKFADIDAKSKKLMDHFWPGPLTIILPIKKGTLNSVVTGGLETAAFRNPATQVTIDLIREAGVPLVGPSANTSGKPSPTKPEHVMHDLDGKIAGVLDDGETKIGVESTVLDMSGAIPSILRPGAITEKDLEPVVGEVQTDHHQVGKDEVPKAPGMKYKHYAPNAQVYIVADQEWDDVVEWIKQHTDQTIGVMATDHIFESKKLGSFDNVRFISLGKDSETASRELFDGLRTFDANVSIKVIFSQKFDRIGIGEAYMNRLQKSAGNTYFSDID
jgi:L-threonylcarbamoyladenylate synthase